MQFAVVWSRRSRVGPASLGSITVPPLIRSRRCRKNAVPQVRGPLTHYNVGNFTQTRWIECFRVLDTSACDIELSKQSTTPSSSHSKLRTRLQAASMNSCRDYDRLLPRLTARSAATSDLQSHRSVRIPPTLTLILTSFIVPTAANVPKCSTLEERDGVHIELQEWKYE